MMGKFLTHQAQSSSAGRREGSVANAAKRVSRSGRAKQPPKRWERSLSRLLAQLIASAALFLVIFVGGGLIPEQFCDVMGTVRQVLSADDSLLHSIETLGQAVQQGENWPAALRDWCVETFLPQSLEASSEESAQMQLEQASAFHRHLLPALAEEDEALSKAEGKLRV